jgi:hypothetical protein
VGSVSKDPLKSEQIIPPASAVVAKVCRNVCGDTRPGYACPLAEAPDQQLDGSWPQDLPVVLAEARTLGDKKRRARRGRTLVVHVASKLACRLGP